MNQNENNMLTLSSEAISAEVGVLGSMLIDEAAVGPVMMAVSEEDFLTQEAKRVFQAIRDRYARGGGPAAGRGGPGGRLPAPDR